MDASALWRAEAAWALAIRDCKDLAWALTQEWMLSIHAAKTSTWTLTREWALAQGTILYTSRGVRFACPLLYTPDLYFPSYRSSYILT